MIKKIVSGGQTGVDQAGLLIASQMGIPIGGWCPKGGLDENRVCVLKQFPQLQEAKTENPDERTKLNIEDSDGTLIVVPKLPLPDRIKDGTLLTISYVKEQQKPYFILSLEKPDIGEIKEWLGQNDIKVLNVAGPRESNSPGIHKEAYHLFEELFSVSFRPAPRL